MSNQRVGYMRLSLDDEYGVESLSIANQRKIISQYAKEHGYEITEFYIDDGVSGYLWNRPSFDRLKQDIEDGLIEGIIVKDLSRLGRNSPRVQLFNEELITKGVELISIGDNYNNLTDDDMMIGITAWANERLVKDTSKKVRAVIHSKQKEGKWISNVPYGYKRIYGKKCAFEIDEITSVYVKRIISNEFYIGTLVQRKMKVVGIHGKNVKRDKSEHIVFENHHEPIIDKETFYLAQKTKDERATKHHKGMRKHNNIFVGLIFCGDCGKPLTPRSGVCRRRYYVCSTYNFHGANYCNNNRVYEDELIEFVKVYLRQCRHSLKGAIENLDSIIKKELKEVCDTKSINSIEALQKEFDKNSNELKMLMEQKVKDIIKNPTMKDIIEETYQQAINDKSNYIQSLKTQIDEQQSISKSSKEVRDGLNKALLLFDEIITSDKLTVKQLKLLVEKIQYVIIIFKLHT